MPPACRSVTARSGCSPWSPAAADLARLVCFRETSTISADDVHAMERAAAVAALLITREDAVTAVENKYKGDFLRDVFLRRAGAEEYVVEHVEAFGWDLDRDLVVVAAEIDPPAPDEPVPSSQVRRRWQERFSSAWRQVSAGFDPGVPSVDFSSEVVTAPCPPRWPCGTWSRPSPATRVAGGDPSPSVSAASRPPLPDCPMPTPRPVVPSRSAGASTAVARPRSSTSSAYTV